ncbi:hypothetical protein OEB94_00565 [Streptomyces sp. ICN988]|uniref:hypothetical protein n=1 Tax=Streptomyces sp. ICN988 TaxID=2983765 RepID=UPI0021E50445|nr:hypothetical protein [Streptomyces sp. ICN988]MCV2457794.1 hypothetical protein [Streptomyces sp. ICN988]
MGRIRVGKPHAQPDTPTHVGGIRQGNEGPYSKQPGHHDDGTSDARRSTGVHWKRHNAIMKMMPNLSPG